jgi:hypothetical protein
MTSEISVRWMQQMCTTIDGISPVLISSPLIKGYISTTFSVRVSEVIGSLLDKKENNFKLCYMLCNLSFSFVKFEKMVICSEKVCCMQIS